MTTPDGAPRSSGRDWLLGDGEERHRANPRRFFIPSQAERESLSVGAVVKLLFVVADPPPEKPSAERMWVEVTAVSEGRYVGVLGNQPASITDLAPGDFIAFGPEHVIGNNDPRWEPYERKLAFVVRRLLEDESLEPGLIIQDPADEQLAPRKNGDRASGWQLYVGNETQEELDDATNVRAPNLAWLMERYPNFGRLVFSGAQDGEWTVDAATGEYRAAEPVRTRSRIRS